MTLRALVVGLGQVGMGYDLSQPAAGRVLTHCRAFRQHPAFELVAGVDPDPDRRQLFEDRYDCPAYADVAAAAVARPDVVAVASPTSLHRETVIDVLEALEPQAILCEKPLADSAPDACAIAAACAARRCALFVNYIRRADPGVQEIRRRLEEGAIRSPVKGVAWYSKGLFNNGSHFVDLLQSWLGDACDFRVVNVGRLWAGSDPEPDFVASFPRGIIYFLAAKEDHFSHYTVELIAPNGRLRYEQGGARISWQRTTGDAACAGYTVLDAAEEIVPSGLDRIQWYVADQLARSLRGEPARICIGSEALRTLEYLDRIRAVL